VASIFILLALELQSLKFITLFSLLKFSFLLLAVLKITGIPTVNWRGGILPYFIIFSQFSSQVSLQMFLKEEIRLPLLKAFIVSQI
jgi:hypothetical protein